MGLRKHVLDGDPGRPIKGAGLGKGHALACPMTLCRELCKMAKPPRCRYCYGLGYVGPRKHVVDGVQILHAKEQFLGERTCRGVPDDSHYLVSRAKVSESIDYELNFVATNIFNKSSAVAEMGDRGHNRHGPKRGGGVAVLYRRPV